MNEWVKTLLSSGAIAGLVGGIVSYGTASYKIDQERYSRQGESGYESLMEANALHRQSQTMSSLARETKSDALALEASVLERKAQQAYVVAQHKIAAFGDASVVDAMSRYYSEHSTAALPCDDMKKFKADLQIYKAIRNTLGVGTNVSDSALATVIFQCNLK